MRTTTTEVGANSDTTLDGVAVLVGVGVLVGVLDDVVVVDADGVYDGVVVAVTPTEFEADGVDVDVDVHVDEGVPVIGGDVDGDCVGVGVACALAHKGLSGTPDTERNSVPGEGVATSSCAPPVGRAYSAVGVVAIKVNEPVVDRIPPIEYTARVASNSTVSSSTQKLVGVVWSTKCRTLYEAGAVSSATYSDVAFSNTKVHGERPDPEKPGRTVVASVSDVTVG